MSNFNFPPGTDIATVLASILGGSGAAQPAASGWPPQPVGGSQSTSPLAQATPAGAAQDERSRYNAILAGQVPQMEVPNAPRPWQNVLAGLADALGTYGSIRYGGPPPQQSYVNSLQQLRQRREAIMARNQETKTQAERENAQRQLDRLDREEGRTRQSEDAKERDFLNYQRQYELKRAEAEADQQKDFLDYQRKYELAKVEGRTKGKEPAGQYAGFDNLRELDTAIRSTADDILKSNSVLEPRPVETTDEYGNRTVRTMLVPVPSISQDDAFSQAIGRYGAQKWYPSAPKPSASTAKKKGGISINDVRQKLYGGTGQTQR